MEAYTTEGCCSLIELRYFDYTVTKQEILHTLKYHYDDFFNESWGTSSIEYPRAIFATTKKEQTAAEQALRELKFKPTRFKSRHETSGNEKHLTFWWRATPPAELRPWLNQQVRKIKRDQRLY